MSEMVKRMDNFSGTVEELVLWCAQRGIDPEDVRITGTHLRYETPQTPEESEKMRVWAERQAKRVEQFERDTFKRLSAKYGPGMGS